MDSDPTITKKRRAARCSKGTRRNKQGVCVKKVEKEKEIERRDLGSDLPETCENDLSKEFGELDCTNEKIYSTECNKFLLKREVLERNCLKPDDELHLYPNLNDKEFNIKIADKKEFADTKYDGTVHTNVQEYADMIANADFELQPHQAFVKNFMSFQTPYNSLLLNHGLGTGKTCSAIGVCEEMRDYMKQMGISKRILIVASENVQDNFKMQLFDERKLKLIDGMWNVKGCVGNKLLKEINPMNMKGIPRDKVINQIKQLINTNYLFLGYGQLANYIIKIINYDAEQDQDENMVEELSKKIVKDTNIVLNSRIIKRLKSEFDNRLIVIDEVHNIRKTEDNQNKKVAVHLELLVKSADNIRLLLLSATPMYNSYKEIIWLLNLMNMNDRRGRVRFSDVFNKDGTFKPDGKEILTRKATGYISYVRGENPYTFPYRAYPDVFDSQRTTPHVKYPSYQMNLKKIPDASKNRILKLYLSTIGNCDKCGDCQYCVYKYIINNLRKKKFSVTTQTGVKREMPNFDNMESFGYTLLQKPLEALIVSYPIQGLKRAIDEIPEEVYSEQVEKPASDADEDSTINYPDDDSQVEPEFQSAGAKQDSPTINPNKLTGREGLERMMDYIDSKTPAEKGSFKYKDSTLKDHGKIFSPDLVGKYSAKIKSIIDHIRIEKDVSEGIILIYSQFIDAGLIPMALALEEMGFTRYGKDVKPLFKTPPVAVVDVRTMKPPADRSDFIPARYSMITGDTRLSPNNEFEVKGLTNEDNINGDKIKVVLISKAGSEGIDLKCIRQVHILEPWYNMNRLEQIFGRAVRNLSHKDLEFAKRNVQIFMHGTILGDANVEEAADLYVYRAAEMKAIQIGEISRVLKQTAVDCIINHDQTNFTQDAFKEVKQIMSTGLTIEKFSIGDAPYSSTCDYMSECQYDCTPNSETDNVNLDTYNENFILMNSEKIIQRIRMLMKESFFYKKDVLIAMIRTPKQYPYIQVYSALTQLIEDKNEFISDKYGRSGRLVNIGNYYLFQPLEIKDTSISIFDRSMPIDYKHEMINFEINPDIVNQPVVEHEDVHKQGKLIFKKLLENFDLTREFTQKPKVPRGDDDWYKHCGVAIRKLSKEYADITNSFLYFLVAHMIESLNFREKMDLANYIYSMPSIKDKTFEWYAKDYFIKLSIKTEEHEAMLLYELDKFRIMILDPDKQWTEAQPEDRTAIARAKQTKQFVAFDKDKYKIFGFIGYDKSNKNLFFKTKDMDKPKDTGATCNDAGMKTLALLNAVIGETKYTKQSISLERDSDGNVTREATRHVELCITLEFILRYYNDIQKDDKKWFMTPDMALYHKIYQINKK